MKRTIPLARKTPLRRKRQPDAVTKCRQAYLAAHPRCAVYSWMPSTEIHEITGGRNRKRSLTEPAVMVAVSGIGHSYLQNAPKARQLAYKLVATPLEFNLDKVNEILALKGEPNPPQAITLADVAAYLEVT